MSKRNKTTKIMAILALFGIIIGIVGTGILIIVNGGKSSTQSTEQSLTTEQYKDLQKLIKSQGGTGSLENSGTTTSETGSTTLTGSLKQ